VAPWYSKTVGEDWGELRRIAIEVLTREAELSEIVRILGSEALSEVEKHIMNVAFMLREGFLKQDAFNPVDTPSAPEKQYWLLRLMITYYRVGLEAVNAGVPANSIRELESVRRLTRLKMEVKNSDYKVLVDYEKKLIDDIRGLMAKVGR